VNSPRQLDVPMSMGIIAFARAGQVCIMTPFTLAGAMAPVSLAGALLLQHVEVLASVALAQTVRAGAPVVYGAFTSNVDMRSGSPAFGTPEAFKGAVASGQLARHIGLPLRSSGSSSSNVEDAQAGYETMMNTSGALFGGANVIMHAAGWQEGGLCASFEKLVLDVEMLQMFAETFAPLDATEPELAYDAIAEVAPGGHFFGSSHTLDRYDRAFYEPLVFSRQNVGQWIDEGSTTASMRASGVVRATLARFEPPPIDDAVIAELDDFVARRTAAGGAQPD
jgi:trimethylamine--corrinoid protein Co-methyltransferase